MKMYNDNLMYFRDNASVLYKTLNEEFPLYNLKIEKDDFFNQYRMIRDNKRIFINSVFDSQAEHEELFKSLDEDVEVIILIGLGDGSVFDYIKNRVNKIKHLIVIEPYLDMFKLFLENYDVKKVFKNLGNISLVVNKTPEDACTLVFDLIKGINYKVNVVAQLSYYLLQPMYFQSFAEQFKIGYRSKLSMFATLNNSRYKWLVNTIYNFNEVNITSEILYDYLKGKPAIIVSAGPSLDKHIDKLVELKDKAIIIAAGSAIKILSKKGIKPHLRVAIDAGINHDIYDDKFYEESEEVPLLYASQLNYKILPKYKGHKLYMLLTTDLIGQYFSKKRINELKSVSSGASVVHSAFSLLSAAGCEPIIFIGQDMCFYDDNLYAEGRSTGKISDFNQRGMIKQIDIHGNEVYTLRNYLQIKYDFENIIKNQNGLVLNATEAGLGINGVPNVNFQETVDRYLNTSFDMDILDYIDQNKDQYRINKEEISEFFNGILDESKKMLEIVAEKRDEILKLESDLNTEKLVKVSNRFNKLNKAFEVNFLKYDYYNFVVKSNIGVQVYALKSTLDQNLNNDSIEYIQMGIRYLHAITTEIEIFLELTKDWIYEVYLEVDQNDEEKENNL